MNKRRLRILAVLAAGLLSVLASVGAASAATGVSGTAAVGTSQELAAHITPPLSILPNTSIMQRNCSSGTQNWVHLRINNPTIGDQCLGYQGTWYNYGYLPISGFCGGNNYGTWVGYDASGNYKSGSFGQGTTYTMFGLATFYSITILGWHGTEVCPY